MMPIHDWSLVFDGAFHAFHHAWIAELQKALNSGVLPPEYYALAEQVAGPTVPGVLPSWRRKASLIKAAPANRSPVQTPWPPRHLGCG